MVELPTVAECEHIDNVSRPKNSCEIASLQTVEYLDFMASW